jgi:hypothetical protein
MTKLLAAVALALPFFAHAGATRDVLPAAESVTGDCTWDLLAPIVNGRSPYSKNCEISVHAAVGTENAAELSFR